MSKVFSRLVWSVWLLWLAGLFGFVVSVDAGAQPTTCNYDGQAQAIAAYDSDSPAVFEYGRVPVLSELGSNSSLDLRRW